MKPEKRLEEIYSALYSYDSATGSHAAETVIKDPYTWETSSNFPFYASMARLIIEAREEADKAKGGNFAAVKRYFKSCTRSANKDLHGVLTLCIDGVFKPVLCNGYSIIALNDNFKNIPESTASERTKNGLANFFDFPHGLEEIAAPSIATIKSAKAENIAKYGKNNNKPVTIAENVTANPAIYIDVLQILGDTTKVYIDPCQRFTPLYFINNKGEKALLLQQRDI